MPYATPTELATFTRSKVDEDQANLLLMLASAAIDLEAGRPLESAERTDGDHLYNQETLWLHWPVTAVESVTVDGTTLDSTQYDWDRDGALWAIPGPWRGEVSATYTCGFAANSAELSLAKLVCLQAVADTIANPQALSSETIGDWARSWANGGQPGVALSDQLTAQLAPLRSRRRLA